MNITKTEKLLLHLLGIPSESGNEQAIAQFLEILLKNQFHIQQIPVNEKRFNLLCVSGKTIKTLFVAHVDTVPGQLPVKINNDFICGRGSCDNKAGLAAMITAAQSALEKNITNFGLLFTVGEETSFDGARFAADFLKKRKIKPSRIIISEPTDLQIVNAQHGILCVEIICTGTQEHSSVPRPDSAIHKLTSLLAHMLAFPFPNTTFHIAKIKGGIAENVVAPNARAVLLFRSEQNNIRQLVQQALDIAHIKHEKNILKFIPPVDHSNSSSLKNSVSYFTEMAFFKNSIVYGPGSIGDAHAATEKVCRLQLNNAQKFYLNILQNNKK